jgi:hypothetical protein
MSDGCVIPVLFSNASLGIFDDTDKLGRIDFDREGPLIEQVEQMAETLMSKLRDKRGVLI